jgi:hypothetical protein
MFSVSRFSAHRLPVAFSAYDADARNNDWQMISPAYRDDAVLDQKVGNPGENYF